MLIEDSLSPINCQKVFKKCPTLFIIWFDSQKTYWILKERNVSQCDAVTYFVSSLCMWKVTISLLLRKKAFDILINLWWKRTFTALLKHIFFKIIIVFLFFKQEKNGFEYSSRNLSLKIESRLSRNPETTKKIFFVIFGGRFFNYLNLD